MAKQFNVLKNKEVLVNQTVASAGGGDYTPPEEGMARARLVAYVEVGKHEKTFKGAKSLKNLVHITFELSGQKWQPKDVDGVKIPQRITIKETLSTNTKAKFYALFLKMRNGREDITHMAEMLGEAFMVRIHHRKYTVTVDGKEVERVAAEIIKDKSWTITPPQIETPILDDEGAPTGDFDIKPVKVAEPISDLRLFIWDHADREQWDSLYIEPGDGDRSRNVFQELIVNAANFIGSTAEAAAAGTDSLKAIREGIKSGKKPQESAGDDNSDDDDDQKADDAAGKKVQKAVQTSKPVSDEVADDIGDIN